MSSDGPIPMLRIAALSDLHIFDSKALTKDGQKPSFLDISSVEASPLRNPFVGLKHLVAKEGLDARYLFCGGDISDRAGVAPLNYGWGELQGISSVLGAEGVVCTTGNHDIDSRWQNSSYDAKGALQSLGPTYPIGLGTGTGWADHYWARNFCILKNSDYRIVVLNSCAFHGSGSDNDKEFLHGRISAVTADRLRAELDAQGAPPPVNILLCHHHPLKNNQISEDDYSEMVGGDQLINLLGTGEFGDWIIIHGHKHYARIRYADMGGSAPIIFSLGSFSAYLNGAFASRATNQFYILEFDLDYIRTSGTGLVGRAKAWDWQLGLGWQPASHSSGIPHHAGFGLRRSTTELASWFHSELVNSGQPYLDWADWTARDGKLVYLTPEDIASLGQRLKQLGIKIDRSSEGRIIQVGREV